MKDIFGEIVPSPELELFERLNSPYEFEEALLSFRDCLALGATVEEALDQAATGVVPDHWSSFQVSQ